jgi:hypothetical protein
VLSPAEVFIGSVTPLLSREREKLVRTTIEYLVNEARRALPTSEPVALRESA